MHQIITSHLQSIKCKKYTRKSCRWLLFLIFILVLALFMTDPVSGNQDIAYSEMPFDEDEIDVEYETQKITELETIKPSKLLPLDNENILLLGSKPNGFGALIQKYDSDWNKKWEIDASKDTYPREEIVDSNKIDNETYSVVYRQTSQKSGEPRYEFKKIKFNTNGEIKSSKEHGEFFGVGPRLVDSTIDEDGTTVIVGHYFSDALAYFVKPNGEVETYTIESERINVFTSVEATDEEYFESIYRIRSGNEGEFYEVSLTKDGHTKGKLDNITNKYGTGFGNDRGENVSLGHPELIHENFADGTVLRAFIGEYNTTDPNIGYTIEGILLSDENFKPKEEIMFDEYNTIDEDFDRLEQNIVYNENINENEHIISGLTKWTESIEDDQGYRSIDPYRAWVVKVDDQGEVYPIFDDARQSYLEQPPLAYRNSDEEYEVITISNKELEASSIRSAEYKSTVISVVPSPEDDHYGVYNNESDDDTIAQEESPGFSFATMAIATTVLIIIYGLKKRLARQSFLRPR